ncbi:transposase [Candidatus Enterovibrio altilux]|uniref:transposase n=1 Tax=Candidatus Enterovibrio altilux TaxID=1927128 RepID=UPI001CC2437B|nr:transposase [Candidatus Enterovibrio luxaltus]
MDGKRLVWWKLHLVVDKHTHEFIAAELSALNMTDGERLSSLLRQTHRKINEILADSASGTR